MSIFDSDDWRMIKQHIPNEEDITILENVTHETLKTGCKECGFMQVIFQTAISIESENKVFFLTVECPACEVEYKEIMFIKPIKKEEKGEMDDRHSSLYK